MSDSKSQLQLHEPESQRLRRDIGGISVKLELERKAGILLEEEIKSLQQQLQSLKGQSRVSNQQYKLKSTVKNLEYKIRNISSHLNEVSSLNKNLREQIDSQRRVKQHNRIMLQDIHFNIKDIAVKVGEQNLTSRRIQVEDENQRIQIQQLRSRSLKDQQFYNDQLNLYSSRIIEKHEDKIAKLRQVETYLQAQHMVVLDSVEVGKILILLKQRYSDKVVKKKLQLEQYIDYIEDLQKAFKKLCKSSGFNSIEQVVTTFIKSQEQQYNLWVYVNDLSAEIDNLEDFLSKTRQTISQVKNDNTQQNQYITQFLGQLQQSFERQAILRRQWGSRLQTIQARFQDLQAPLQRLLKIMNNQIISQDFVMTPANFSEILSATENFLYNVNYRLMSKKNQNFYSSLKLESIPSRSNKRNSIEVLKETVRHRSILHDTRFEDNKEPFQLPILRERAMYLYDQLRKSQSTDTSILKRLPDPDVSPLISTATKQTIKKC